MKLRVEQKTFGAQGRTEILRNSPVALDAAKATSFTLGQIL
jgi:hypothetical protein